MGRFTFWLSIICLILVVLFGGICTVHTEAQSFSSIKEQIANTGLLADGSDETLFISTLDGALHAVTKRNGAKKWILKSDPVVQNSNNSEDPPIPRFFPNPQDGSLYRYSAGRGRDPLKKLPFTIPELVANSPCRSNDGIFYIGKKVDSWVGVDSITGKKQLILGSDSIEKVCPKPSRNTIYIGRTLYNIVLFEMNTGHQWNVSFYHYTTNADSTPIKNYDLVHYAATGTGSMLTVDRNTGVTLWELEFDSPVVSMFLLDSENTLVSVPLTTVTPQTLQRFSLNFNELSQMETESGDILVKELSPTIFVGESANGVYAIPAFVDTGTARISRKESQLLLDGPPGQRGTIKEPDEGKDEKSTSNVLLLGYYDLPENVKSELSKATAKEIGSLYIAGLPLAITDASNVTDKHQDNQASQDDSQDIFWHGSTQIKSLNASFFFSGDFVRWTFHLNRMSLAWLFSDPLNFMVASLTFCLFVIMILLYRQAQDYARLSREVSSRRANSSRGSNSGSSSTDVTSVAEELEDGRIKVGKIYFEPDNLLGKGCDGTFVFKGSFDGRSIAVKRVLPGCFSIADREVDLLRESDQHPNVIRYFCMEQCRQFRYIALELCSATLNDYVHNRIQIDVPAIDLLRQATSGLHHLHSLDIVHRDIKPHNVLISTPNSKGEIRAMISDFGLCKRLEGGRMSFSKKSGVTGTEGWIAPEMVTNARPSSKVDIFSLGCVYYYIMSKGKHPFGSVLDRQSNILSGKYILDALDKDSHVFLYSLITKMLSSCPYERPPTGAILKHPIFWHLDKILQFFQDASDRIEKESGNSLVVMNIERSSNEVVREDWTRHMHPIVSEDLRRFREYNGKSVRDLLRALRNKKNHYRELPEGARNVFGRIPEDFVPYWTIRFPRLLPHTWYALQCCKTEPIFARYYCSGFSFKSEYVHDTVSLSPNNKPYPSPNFSSTSPVQRPISPGAATYQPREKKKDPYDYLDNILGPQGKRKGPKNPPKHDKNTSGTPWVITRPQNIFEPQYRKSQPPPVVEYEENIQNKNPNEEYIEQNIKVKKKVIDQK